MEGTGSNYRRERRAPRILDFDLNKEPEPEPELVAEQERHPHDEAPEVLNPASPRIRVIHNWMEENPQADVLFDISNVAQNEVDMIVNSRRFASEGKELQVQSFKVHEDGGVSVSLRLAKISEVDGNISSAADKSAKESSGAAGRKRARSGTNQDHLNDPEDATSSSTEVRFGPPKIKWKSQHEEGDAQIQHSWSGEQQASNNSMNDLNDLFQACCILDPSS